MAKRGPGSLRLYARFIGVSFRSQLQYRLNLVIQTVGHFGGTFIEFVAIVLLFQRFPRLDIWSLREVAVFYGFISLSFAIADAMARGFDLFGDQVRTGSFDRLLLRPRSTVLQLLGHELTLKRAGRFVQGIALIAWGLSGLEVSLTAPRILLLGWAASGNVALFVGLTIVQATMCFWTIEALELMNSLTYGGAFAARYPMSIYDRWLRRLFTYAVPLTCTAYFPIVAFLGKTDPLGTPRWFQWIAPSAGVLFLLVSLQIWACGVRRYRSSGS